MPPLRFLLIYGSQTGQSEAISEQIALSCGEDLYCDLKVAEGLTGDDLLKEQVVVFVVSSTGEGDPPENFEEFWNNLHDYPDFSNLKFTLLGLGDTNYTEFGGFPNSLNQFLAERGAKSFYEYQLADDAVGLEHVVEPWIEGLWSPLRSALSPPPSLADKLAALSIIPTGGDDVTTKHIFSLEWSDEKEWNHSFPHGVDKFILPFTDGTPLEHAPVLSVTPLTSDPLVKSVFEIEVASKAAKYGPGDSFGVLCENRDREVTSLLSRLSLYPHTPYRLHVGEGVKPRLLPKHVLMECTPWYAFKYTLDVHSLPKKAFLKYLGECCGEKRDGDLLKHFASKEGSGDLNEMIYSPGLTLLELLNLFPSCRPDLDGLLQFLPRLTPRYYSVSRITEQGIKFVFNIITDIRNSTPLSSPLPGVCSTYLSSLSTTSLLHIYRRKNTSFIPPSSPGSSMILIGAGTGVSPFLGFLDNLNTSSHVTDGDGHVTESSSHVTLITGNRYRALDSVYESEFQDHVSGGRLNTWYRAFSRNQDAQWKYVQDVVRDKGEELVDRIVDKGAAVYVCGDAKGLGAGVWDAFVEMVGKWTGRSREDSEVFMKDLRTCKRYCEDIWS